MHPLSFFPTLLTFGLIAPFLLRITVGAYGLAAGWARYHKAYKWTSIIYAITSVLLIIGLYTQVSALVGIIVIAFDYIVDSKVSSMTWEQKMLRKICVISLLCLIFTGPGFFGMDLPL